MNPPSDSTTFAVQDAHLLLLLLSCLLILHFPDDWNVVSVDWPWTLLCWSGFSFWSPSRCFVCSQGPKVVVGNFTVSGTGTAIANSALLQNQTYFEVTLLSPAGPPWSIGLTSNRKHDLNLDTLVDRPGTVCLSSSQSSSLSVDFKKDDI